MDFKYFDKCHNPVMGYHVLRISLAVLMILHGFAKVQNGTAGIEGMLANIGLPAFLAYGVYIGELVAPLMLLAGVYVVPASVLILINMAFAVGLAHAHQLFMLNPKTGGYQLELQAFIMVAAVVMMMITPKGQKSLFERPYAAKESAE